MHLLNLLNQVLSVLCYLLHLKLSLPHLLPSLERSFLTFPLSSLFFLHLLTHVSHLLFKEGYLSSFLAFIVLNDVDLMLLQNVVVLPKLVILLLHSQEVLFSFFSQLDHSVAFPLRQLLTLL